ncbi:MAG: glutamate-cysteine ligase family protein [Actinomycetota bacterium]|nr:glutamate-cysteine ligase family protein [Actinomycetota bacterium]
MGPDTAAATVLRDRASAEGYVASICFKHGPPRWYGVELEWTVHHADDPARPLDTPTLAGALGPHAPGTLADDLPDAPAAPLPHGSTVTVEPGGQVELSTSPHEAVPALLTAACGDLECLDALLADSGLVRGDLALDGCRPPTRLLRTPRYAAMQKAFDRIGPYGTRMMCSTAAVQVCLDVGEPHQVPARWAALHGLGPVMVALFANSAAVDPDGRAWESARMQSVLGTDPARMLPPPAADPTEDPAPSWARRVLDTPLLCLRRPGGCWDAPAGTTFADWVAGALPHPPTTDDLDYHLSTVFPPVRPRGYFEVRYLDAQPGTAWITPVTLLAALMAHEDTVRSVVEVTAPVTDLWFEAARQGLANPAVAVAAQHVLDLGCEALDSVDVPAAPAAQVLTDLAHRRAALTPSKR